MPRNKTGYKWLMILTFLLTLAAISTLLPQATASKACYLGYKAHCTFTPISTIICLLLAGAICKVRNMLFK